jgi:hypothetical protein
MRDKEVGFTVTDSLVCYMRVTPFLRTDFDDTLYYIICHTMSYHVS